MSRGTAKGSRREEARPSCHFEGRLDTTPTLCPRAEVSASSTSRGENVSDVERIVKYTKVRSDFEDIFNVNNYCGSDEFSYGIYKDDMNVAGSLSLPSSIQFFEKLGAPTDVISTLKNGHVSKLTPQVPSFERENNQSYRDNEEFGIEALLELI